MKFPKRGEVYWVNLDPTVGSEIKKTRPALVVSNDIGNRLSSRVTIAPITSNTQKVFPFQVAIDLAGKKGKVLLDQLRTVDKKRLGKKIAECDFEIMDQVDDAIKTSLDLV